MANPSIVISLLAEFKDAIKEVKKFSSQASKSLNAVGDALSDIKAIGATVVAALAFKQIIDEASAAEEALNSMVVSLKLAGDFSERAKSDFEALAEELQETSRFSDEAALNAVALAKSLGLSNDETKRLVPAAADLASVLGIDLNQATELLAKSLEGNGTAIARQIPQLRGLTDEQFRAGAALDFVSERFRGAAEASSKTFAGSLIVARNSFSNLLETLGKFATESPVVAVVLQDIVKGLKSLNSFLIENKKAISDFVNKQIYVAISAFHDLLRVIQRILPFFKAFSVIPGFDGLVKSVDSLQAEMGELRREAFKAGTEAKEAFKVAGEQLKNNNKVTQEAISNTENLRKEAEKLREEYEKKLSSGGFLKEASENAARGIIPVIETELGINIGKIDLSEFQQRVVGSGLGFVKQVLNGAKGASEIFPQILGEIANKLIPGIGPIISEIVGILQLGPEHVKNMVTEFATALPALAQNIANAIPVFIQTIIQHLPQIVTAMASLMPQVVNVLVRESPRIIQAIISAIPAMFVEFAKALVDSAFSFIDAIWEAIKSIIPFAGDSAGSQTSSALGGGVLGTVGRVGLGLVTGGLSELFEFADGGVVPQGFPNDTFPARLTSGEVVLNEEQQQALLNGGGAPQSLTVNLVVGEQQLANVLLSLNKRGFRTA